MLRTLTISDLALIRHLDIEFSDGLTVITGETGAGKSMLVDALGLALGDRADVALLRPGAAHAVVTAVFDPSHNAAAHAIAAEQGLEVDTELVLRRVINADGRSRAFCNEQPVTAQLLRRFGESLLDIHSQHAHQSLLRRDAQLQLVDEFGALQTLRAAVHNAYQAWQKTEAAYNATVDASEHDDQRGEFLEYQLQELTQTTLSPTEWRQLNDEHRRLAHAARLVEICAGLEAALFSQDNAIEAQLQAALDAVAEATALDPDLANVQRLLSDARVHLGEARHELAQYATTLSVDPEHLATIEQQIGDITDLARKHRCAPEELSQVIAGLQAELEKLADRDERLAALAAARTQHAREYRDHADALSSKRREAALKMSTLVSARMQALGMPRGRFEIALSSKDAKPAPHGIDRCDYLVSTNPDLPPQPLRKIASGGELSRISLAVQVATAGLSGVPTLVYDEVDAGVGGQTATEVGDHLRSLAASRQILCITHLPQVAGVGDHHLSIQKRVVAKTTEVHIAALQADQRIDEIARMLGGDDQSRSAHAHAKTLLTGP